MIYLIFVLAVATLIALYKFFPNRRIFVYFCATLAIVFCISAYIQMQYSQAEVVSRAQIENIREQQKIFGYWYAEYQKDIEHLDRNWQLYHSIIETFKTEEIYDLSTYEQLLELETDALEEQQKIHALKIPRDLNYECAVLLAEVIKKTRSYTDAQTKIISEVRMAAEPENFRDLKILNEVIREITIRESPAGLFTATEIAAIRENLIVPGEGVAR